MTMPTARFARAPAGTKRALAVLAIAMASTATAAPALRCALEAPARVAVGSPVMLRLTLTNAGAVPLQVLRWNTPLEGAWFARFVEVTHEGRRLSFGGPTMKRGDPGAPAYVRLEPGASASGEVDLALPFDLSKPGRYHVAPRLRLVDVFDAGQATAPRPRSAHEGMDLDCPAIDLAVVPAARG